MKRSIVPFLVLFFILVPAAWPAEPSIANGSVFHVIPLGKIMDSPVDWVTAGGGVLAYGSGREIRFAFEEKPDEIVSSLSFDQNVSEVLILGQHAFIGQEDSGIRLLDLADPSEPIDLGLYTLSVSASHLASWGNLLLVGDGGLQVRLFEINIPGDQRSSGANGPPPPTPPPSKGEGKDEEIFVDKGSIAIGTPVTAITVAADGKAYIAVANEVMVYDLSDLSNPAEVDSFSLNVPIRSMAVNGKVLFAAAGADGLQVFDLSVPGKTATLATYGAPGESLYIAGRKLYLAGGANGLQLLEVGPSGATTFHVQVGDFGFVPYTITINAGDTVRWIGQRSGPPVIKIEGPPLPLPFPSKGGEVGEGGPSGTFHVLIANGSSTTKTERLTSPHIFDTPGTFQMDCISPYWRGGPGIVNVVTPLASSDISITPPSVDFGKVAVGTSSDQIITITNPSSPSLEIKNGRVGSLPAPFSVVSIIDETGNPLSPGQAFALLPGHSVFVTVRFSPTSASAVSPSANLHITYTKGSDQGLFADVPLTGTKVDLINISVTPTSVNFGNVSVGQTPDKTITIGIQAGSTAALTVTVGNLLVPFSIVSGGGTFTLNPGDQPKSVVVRFSPTATGAVSQNLTITHNAGNQTNPAKVSLSGTGTNSAINISINPTSVIFGNVSVGQILDQTVTITNQGISDTLTGNVGTLSPPFSVVSGGGAFSLTPGQSQSVVVQFSPAAAGTANQNLSITHNAGNQASPATVSLSGTGGPAPPATINISISPTSVDFGSGAVGQIFEQTLTITNQASSTGTLAGNVGVPSPPFSVVSGSGAFSLTPGQSKPVVVRFSPTATGPFSGTLSINHNAGNQNSPANVPLSGTGIPQIPGAINISVSPLSVNFGNVALGQISDRTVTVTNLTGSTGTLTGTVAPLSAPFSIVSGGEGFNLSPGQSKSIVVRFAPTALGQSSGTLSITHNAANQNNPINVPLSGTGVTPVPAAITVTPASVDFGAVTIGQISDRTITITNQAGSTEILTGNAGAPSAPFLIVSGGGDFSLTPGQSKSVVLRFLPTAAGTASGNLTITHNASNQSNPINIPLSGTAVAPPPVINISISPRSIDFGNVTLGQSLDRTITIANQSNSTGALTGSVGAPSGSFSIVSGGGPFSLTPGQSTTVTVRFSPVAEGAASGDLSITHNGTNENSPTHVSLSGTGVASGGQNIVISFISGPTTGKPGGRISIQNTVTNEGTPPANSVTLFFYLSTDTQIDTSDRLIGKRTIRNLAPGASSGPVSTQVTLPRDVAPGAYFIGAIVTSNTGIDPQGITICLSLLKPALLSPKNRGKDVSLTPTLDWSGVNGAASYEVEVATDSGFADIVAFMTGLTDTQWTVAPALNSGAAYFWRVRAVNDCGPGPWSPTWSFKTEISGMLP